MIGRRQPGPVLREASANGFGGTARREKRKKKKTRTLLLFDPNPGENFSFSRLYFGLMPRRRQKHNLSAPQTSKCSDVEAKEETTRDVGKIKGRMNSFKMTSACLMSFICFFFCVFSVSYSFFTNPCWSLPERPFLPRSPTIVSFL